MRQRAAKVVGALVGLAAGLALGALLGILVGWTATGELPALTQLGNPAAEADVATQLQVELVQFAGGLVGVLAGPPAGYLAAERLLGQPSQGGPAVVAAVMVLTLLGAFMVVSLVDGGPQIHPLVVLVVATILGALLGGRREQSRA